MAYNAVNQLTNLSRSTNSQFSILNSQFSPIVDTNYTYDNNQRLIKLAHVKGGSTVASYDYSYDNADKLAQTVSSSDGTSNYSYDATNQLTGASHSSQTLEAYSYDANGNRTSGGTVTGANNQLLSDGTYSYQYDGEGNRTQRTEIATGKVTEYVWDYRNRLASVLFKDGAGVVTKTIESGHASRVGNAHGLKSCRAKLLKDRNPWRNFTIYYDIKLAENYWLVRAKITLDIKDEIL